MSTQLRRRCLVLMAAALVGEFSMAVPSHPSPSPLGAWHGKSRLLAVFAPAEDDPDLQMQRQEVAAARAGMSERDLVIIETVGDHTTASDGSPPGGMALRGALAVPDARFTAILIGKDGGEKLRDSRPISAERLFRIIDSMPMRRDETTRRGG